jgi:hypothetical protein
MVVSFRVADRAESRAVLLPFELALKGAVSRPGAGKLETDACRCDYLYEAGSVAAAVAGQAGVEIVCVS